jgi:primosomal protein N' (replication factor Y) (superfamily II helicase)
MILIGEVAVFSPNRPRSPGVYSYAIPETLIGISKGCLVDVPFGASSLIGLVTGISHDLPEFALKEISACRVSQPILTPEQIELAKWISNHYLCSLPEVLALFVPLRLRPTPEKMYAARAAAERPGLPESDENVAGWLITNGPAGLAAMKKAGFGRGLGASLKRLKKLGLVEESWSAPAIKARLGRAQANEEPGRMPIDLPPVLSLEQGPALRTVIDAMNSKTGETFLLHGVTGSGKTELYLRAVGRALRQNRTVLILVPEISLTPQAISGLEARFPGIVSVIHSGRTEKQRWDDWNRVKAGEARVVVGSRSALFAPLSDLGLIVVDEEHEWTYKSDQSPRYHARDVAVQLGKLNGAPVILSSATPDVVTYYKARTGTYKLLELKSRISASGPGLGGHPLAKSGMPEVEIIDLRQELRSGNSCHLSKHLQRDLRLTLESKEQAILFLNRRGTATLLMCRSCGHVERCPDCGMAMVYHRAEESLICHHCGTHTKFNRKCPECESGPLSLLGMGTEKLAAEVSSLFPEARVLRWDSDAERLNSAAGDILTEFGEGAADILVGTQIVAKGLDLPCVTLVAAVAADVSLYMPDFRAAERTFQLLTQVGGRAGRRRKPGKVLIQTYSPEHYSIQAAAAHDYLMFYRKELRFRKEASYPPFTEMIRYTYSTASDDRTEAQAWSLAAQISDIVAGHCPGSAKVLGPSPCFIHYWKGRYRWQVTVIASDMETLRPLLPTPVGWAIDVDPVNSV